MLEEQFDGIETKTGKPELIYKEAKEAESPRAAPKALAEALVV